VVRRVSIEYIIRIRDQEELAERIRQDGLAESKRIISAAKDEAGAIIKSAQIESEKSHKEALKRAEISNKDDYDRIIHQAKTECRMIKQGAEKRMDEAAELIVDWVVNEWQS
jgi:vacuolar-type H+-ATPase subunit H